MRLAETLLCDDAFDRWDSLRKEHDTWTFAKFRYAMMVEYCLDNLQVSRQIAFYTTMYDPYIHVDGIIQQFRRELMYCRGLCTSEVVFIPILSMKLDPLIVHHLSTMISLL